jgi:HD-like signal output (HDOD) protein
MQNELPLEQAKALVNGIDIPVRPKILQQIMVLHNSEDPDIHQIAQLISADVSLSAGVLKAVNSPLFGLRNKMSSIQHATSLLGVTNVINLVMGIALRLEIGGRFNVAVERFWDTASDVALISAGVAKTLGNVAVDEAYTLGLFHDCGIPLLMMKYPDYVQLLKGANADVERSITEVEDATLNTNHAVVGYYVAKSWRIPDRICSCILNHHESDMFESGDVAQNNLLANLKICEAISHSLRRLSDNPEWERLQGDVLGYLGLSDKDFEELREDMGDKLSLAA